MIKLWQTWSVKIDALSLRERAMVCAAAVALMLGLIFFSLLDPLYVKHRNLLARIAQQQSQIAGSAAEMTQKIDAFAIDPDQGSKLKLKKILDENAQMGAAMRAVQKGLVAPDKIVLMLEQILKDHASLHLLSLKTLAPSGMVDGGFAEPAGAADGKPELKPDPAAPPKPAPLLYRHGVEIVLQGSYLDMLSYMETLEAMPAQVFWGKASLKGDNYPNASLTLTLYTLSLDQKWLAL
ncbi:MSHA biogenesis protein MshJ [Oxalobacteraceae bacterium GrIS 1.11]